jgi:tetratricopeptide (TPR) repeat protein
MGLAILLVFPTRVAAHTDIHEQIVAVTERIQQDPNNAALYLKRGELHRSHQDWDAALADYERAIQIDPDLSVVDLARGNLWLEAGQPKLAKIALDRFLAKQPTHAKALATRARALAQLGQGIAAAKDFTQAIGQSLNPAPEYYLERAQALASVGEEYIDQALQGLDEGITKLGPLVTLQLLAIDLELKKKRYDAALARLEEVAAQSQRKEMWLIRRGEIMEQAGRGREAYEAYAQALVAIESLPARHRQIKAMVEQEARLRAILKGQAAELGKQGSEQQP